METIFNYLSEILIVIAAICTLVSIITQLIKELPLINNIPTRLVVVVLSQIISLLSFFAYASYTNMTIRWYYVLAIIFAGFFIAHITSNGWASLIDIFNRFSKGPRNFKGGKKSEKDN